MYILGIETSTNMLSVGLSDDNNVLVEININTGTTHCVNLMNSVKSVLEFSKININEIGLICVDKGPGSFTSLRIGISCVRQFSQMLGIPIVTLNSLDVLAKNISDKDKIIFSCIDGSKNRIYLSIYDNNYNNSRSIERNLDISPEMLLERTSLYKERELILIGTGFLRYKEFFLERNSSIKDKFDMNILHYPLVRNVISLGHLKYKSEGGENFFNVLPEYIRKSEAEENIS